MSKSLDQPARKFFLKDLQSCSEDSTTSPPGESSRLKEWHFHLKSRPIPFSVVWLQGVIVKVLIFPSILRSIVLENRVNSQQSREFFLVIFFYL